MPTNDFTLNFGSNAEAFSKSIASELSPGVKQINDLTAALLKYDETVGSMRAGNPLGGLFSQLDQAAGKLEGIGDKISGQFSKIVNSLSLLSRDLNEALEAVGRSAAASRSSQQRRNKNGFTDEEQRVIDSQRRNATQVTDKELTPAKVRTTESTLAKATKDGDAARNAVKRVADINATLARNATDSANALKNLGQAIRTLTTQTKTTTKGVEEGRFQQVIVLGGGNVAGGPPVQIDQHAIQQMLANAGVPDAAQAPARDAAHQALRDAAEAKRTATRLEREQFSEPARPGSYQVPGEGQVRIVSNRLNPGETFGGYFERTSQNAAMLNNIRKDVVAKSEERLKSPRLSQDLQRIQQLIGRRGLDELAGDPKFRQAYKTPGSVPAETIRASVGSVLAPGKSLTKEQYAQVPQALAEYQAMQKDFAELARLRVSRSLMSNPAETFAFPQETGVRRDAYGSMGDFRAQIGKYDEEHGGPGAEYRREVEARVAESRANRSAVSQAWNDLYNPGQPGTKGVDKNSGESVRPEAGRVLGEGAKPSGRELRSQEQQEEIDARRNRSGARDRLRSSLSIDQQRLENLTALAAKVKEVKEAGGEPDLRLSREAASATGINRRFAENIGHATRPVQGGTVRSEIPIPLPDIERAIEAKIAEVSARQDANVRKLDSLKSPIEDDAFIAQARAEARASLVPEEKRAQNLSAGGGGGAKPPTTPPVAAAAAEPPEDRDRLEQTVANRRQKVSRLRDQYEQAYGQGEDLTALTAQLANAMRRLETAENKLAAATEKQAVQVESATTAGKTAAGRVAGGVKGKPFEMTANVEEFAAKLQQSTRDIIESVKAELPGLTGIDRTNAIERAGTAMRNDPAFRGLRNVSAQRETLGTLLQLPRGGATNTVLGQVYGRGGGSAALGSLGLGGGADAIDKEAKAAAESTAAMRRYEAVRQQFAGTSAEMQRAQLGLLQAEEKINGILSAEIVDVQRLIAAERELIAAKSAVSRISAAEEPKSVGTKVFGQQGFGAGQLRHIGLGLENMIGFSLVFEGFDKLKELVHDGLEAQAAFARLQASLDANGISAGNLRQDFQNISAETATPLEQVTEAAAELSGTLKTAGDIQFGAEIASQLANISQGTLTAKEAAVGLRDVIAAYGDVWSRSGTTMQEGIQQTGDDIAKLSQLTGVNVKDITEGTTQIAAEARDFGLNQRQAETLTAYVIQGTGETGEQAGAQTSRLLSGLYKTPTQQTLQRVLKPTNSQGLSIAQQFASGDIGGVLTELIQQYGKLNDSSKQAVASMLGTGIQARAFAALIGGGANAVKALNGQLDSTGALSKQNQTYLQTIAGEIKQLDEDFQNLGSTLQRIGAFDALGALAKTVDDILKVVNALGGALSKDYFGIPTGKALHFAVALGEVAAAWKLVGGVATRWALGTGVGSRVFGGITPRNAEAMAAAEAAGVDGPKARYRFRDVARQPFATRFGRSPVDPVDAERNTVRGAEQRQIVATTESLSGMTTASATAADALRTLAGAASEAATAEEAVTVASGEAATAQVAGGGISAAAVAEGALFSRASLGAGGAQGVLPFGAAGTNYFTTSRMAAAEAAAATEGQMLLPLRFKSPTTGRFASPASVAAEDAARQTERTVVTQGAAEGALPGMTRNELLAQQAATAETSALPAEEQAAKLGLLARTGAGGLGLLRSPMAGVLGAVAAGYIGLQYLHGADQEEDSRDAAAKRLLSGGTNARDLTRLSKPRSFLDYDANTGPLNNDIPVLHTLGQVGNIGLHTGEEIFKYTPVGMLASAFGLNIGGGGSQGASDASQNAFFKLQNQVIGGFNKGSAGAKAAAGHQTIKDTLPKLTSVDQIETFQRSVEKEIDKQREKIQKAGGNDKQAQAQIAANINQLKQTLETAAQHRILALKGLHDIDVLNVQQIGDLQNALGEISQLNPQTLATQKEAVLNLIQSGSLNPKSAAYKDLLSASGIVPDTKFGTKAGTTGLNAQGQVGYYDSKGQFHEVTGSESGGIASDRARLQNITAPGVSTAKANTLGVNAQGQIGEYDSQGRFHQHEGYVSPSQAEALSRTRVQAPGTASKTKLLQALKAGYQQSIDNANAVLATIGTQDQASSAKVEAAQKLLQTGLTGVQQVNDQIYQAPIQVATNQAALAASLSGTGGNVGGPHGETFSKGTAGAVTDLKSANKALEKYNATLTRDDPAYWSNLSQIEQNKQQIAHLQNSAAANALAISAAGTADQVQRANIALQQAQLNLRTDRAAGASADQIGADQAAIAGGKLNQAQAQYGVVQAGGQLNVTRNRNSVARGQAELTNALRDEAKYRSGQLADQQAELTAQNAEIQARQSIADALEAQRESVYSVTSALDKFHGDAIGAATADLAKAEDAYRYAVQQYGKNSQQAREAYAAMITSKSAKYDAVTQQITAGLDLEITELNARGVGQGSDLGQAASRVSVQKAQVALNRYLKKGGVKGTDEYDKLYGAVIAAQRAQFDTALQAQLDTLDFQKETYQITGAQEIASLQQILKNKQLTLAEQRSITLKIKSLQQGIREQLTQGGLNIPSDIKLPTAYDVRRSLGAGFGGAGTTANVVNNNQRSSVTVNQTLPTSAMAKAVAAQVITLINQQTGQQVRANSSSPRNVPVGRR